MIPMKCKTCGGNILPAGDGAHGVCESCGNTFMLPTVQQEETSQPSPAALDGQEASVDKDTALGKLIQGIQAAADQNAVMEGNATSADEAKQEETGRSLVPEQAQEHQLTRRDKKFLLGLLIVVALIVVIPILISNIGKRLTASRYNQAITAFDTQDYLTAVRLFESLEDYEDAPKWLQKAKCSYGQQLVAKGEFYAAVRLLRYSLDTSETWAVYLTIPIKYRYGSGSVFELGKLEIRYHDSNSLKPVRWRVLTVKDDQFLVVSTEILECMPFDNKGSSVWKTSSLRAWLNGGFIDTVFSPEEQSLILPTTLEPDMADYVFLLTEKDVWNYRLDYWTSLKTRYDIYDDLEKIDGHPLWYLRTTAGPSSLLVAYGYNGQEVRDAKDTHIGIRPAMWVDGNATGF